jgi:hypothetical protein
MKKLPTVTTYFGKNIKKMSRENLIEALEGAALEIESLRDMVKTNNVVGDFLKGFSKKDKAEFSSKKKIK